MTDVVRICAAALTVAVAAFLLRELGWRGAVAFSIFGAAIFLSFLTDGLSRIGEDVSAFSEYAGVSEVAKEIFKVMGVSYVFGISSDICSDLGEKTLSASLATVGRIELLLIAMPYFLKITRAAAELVGA